MALTRTPDGASSIAIERVAVITQPLLALYQVRLGRGLTPAVEAMLRMAPAPARFIIGAARRAVRNTDLTLTASSRSNSASESASIARGGWATPALLTRMSSRPNA